MPESGLQAVHTGYQDMVAFLLLATWLSGVCAVLLPWCREWRRIRAAIGSTPRSGQIGELPILSTDTVQEPGVYGVLHPVLLLPARIMEYLSPAQIDAVVAHEMAHVRRCDNLSATLHMLVCALFWFHPAVWWIEARLLEERERACDEAVLAAGSDPELYAESILLVCRYSLASSLPCLSGVTGADLKQRIVNIVSGGAIRRMTLTTKLLLSLLVASSAAVPVAVGLVQAQSNPATSNEQAPAFDVVSIRKVPSDEDRMSIGTTSTMYNAKDIFAETLLGAAFQARDFQIIGGPQWIHSNRYTVEARFPSGFDLHKMPPAEGMKQFSLMIRSLLVERFHLRYHMSTREFPGYSMITAKGGPKLQKSAPGEEYGEVVSNEKIVARGMTAAGIADQIGLNLDQKVQDNTGLTGTYSFTLSYPPDRDPSRAPETSDDIGAHARLIAALADQLGLKLVAQKIVMPVIIIDGIDPPTPN